jgi:hypothetical protein
MSSVAKIMGCGSATNERQENDLYETPAEFTELLCTVEHLPSRIWEPSSGNGAIARVLKAHGIEIIESDLISYTGQLQLDFLAATSPLALAIATNPPFDIASEYVAQAYSLGVQYLALLLKSQFLNTVERQRLFAQVGHPTRVWPSPLRPDFLGQKGPPMDICWFVWDGWHAPHSIIQPVPLSLTEKRRSPKWPKIAALIRHPKAAERTAARLLCQYPGIDFNDQGLVINRCLEFKVDLRAQSIGYNYEHVKRSVQQLRAEAAMVAGTSWSPDDLRQQAQKLYDSQKDVEGQVAEFYAAQARYQIMKAIRNGSGAHG